MNVLVDDVTVRQAGVVADGAGTNKSALCPRAEALITRHTVRHAYGMAGCAQLFGALDDPGRYKRKAAEAIVRIRRTRQCRGHGRIGAEARLLTKAAAYRRQAAALQARTTSEFGAMFQPPPPPPGTSPPSNTLWLLPGGMVP